MKTRFHFHTFPIVAQKVRELKKSEGKTISRIVEDIARDRVPDLNKVIGEYTTKLIVDIDSEVLEELQNLAKTHRTSASHILNCMIVS